MKKAAKNPAGVTEQLADFIVGTSYNKLPKAAVDKVKAGLVDYIGVSLAGSVQDTGQKITSFVKGLGGKAQSSVIGGGYRTSPPNAALVNGTIGHALDYDDYAEILHPSVVLMPPILALGEKLKSSGRETIEAYAVGFDVAYRLGAITGMRATLGWHATGVGGIMGAAAAAAKILKLDKEATRVALGIAASEAAGLIQNFGTMTKPFHAGAAAKNGVIAAMLAAGGFTASPSSIEGDIGYAQVFSRGEDKAEKVTAGLGAPFLLGCGRNCDLSIKKYPTCAGTHRALDAILYIINKYGVTADQVEEIECEGPPRWFQILIYHDPKDALQGKFSLEFCMAIALLDGKLGLAQFTDEKVNAPRTKAFIKKVVVRSHPNWVEGTDRWEVADKVTVKLKNGKQYSREVIKPAGHSAVPMTWDELAAKYEDCAAFVLKETDIRRSLDLMEHLETQPNLAALMDIVVAKKK